MDRPAETRCRVWPLACVCFVLPLLVTGVVAAGSGTYPFGDGALVTWDEKYQYVDFFLWLKRVMAGEASLLYTTASGLGSNAWGAFSYYLSSPFNVLLALFDADHVEDFIYVVTSLKLGCAGAAMAYFLRRRYGCGTTATVVLAVGYACSSWSMTQCSNIMWLDVLYILPFMLYGCHRFVRAGRWRMLVLSTAAAVITCWYMGYVAVLFAILYTIYELYLVHIEKAPSAEGASTSEGASAEGVAAAGDVGDVPKKEPGLRGTAGRLRWRGCTGGPLGVRDVARCALRYAGCMLLSLVLSAFTFVPTVAHMLSSDDGLKTHSILERVTTELAKLHLPSSDAFVVAVLAALAVVMSLVVVFLLSKRVNVRVRAVVAVLFALVVTVASVAVAYCKFGNLIDGFLPFSYDLWMSPQFYAGCVPLILAVPYLLDRAIPMRERVATGVFALVVLLSCINSLTYCAWCGMRVPGGFFCRVAFLFVAVLVGMAARTWGRDGFARRPWWHVLAGAALAWALIALSFLAGTGLAASGLAAVTVLVEAALLLGLMRSRGVEKAAASSHGSSVRKAEAPDAADGREKPHAAHAPVAVASDGARGKTRHACAAGALGVLLVVATCCELAGSGALAWQSTHADDYTHDAQTDYMEAVSGAVAQVKAADDGYYRLDKTFVRAGLTSLFEGMSCGYNALSSYTSAHNGRALALLEALGYGDQDMFTVEYASPITLTDSLFGVKYVLSKGALAGMRTVGEAQTAIGALTLSENESALPLAYLVDAGASESHLLSERNPFAQQNAFISALAGRDLTLYRPLEATQTANSDGSVTYTVELPAGENLYYYVQGESAKDSDLAIYASVDGGAPVQDAYGYRHGIYLVAAAGDAPATHTVTLTTVGALQSGATCLFYTTRSDEVARALADLQGGKVSVADFSDGHISLCCITDSAGTLMVTVPDDDGWDVTVNGQRVTTAGAYDGALMLVPVGAGENHVEATFTPPGLYAGAAVSAAGFIVLVALWVLASRRGGATR